MAQMNSRLSSLIRSCFAYTEHIGSTNPSAAVDVDNNLLKYFHILNASSSFYTPVSIGALIKRYVSGYVGPLVVPYSIPDDVIEKKTSTAIINTVFAGGYYGDVLRGLQVGNNVFYFAKGLVLDSDFKIIFSVNAKFTAGNYVNDYLIQISSKVLYHQNLLYKTIYTKLLPHIFQYYSNVKLEIVDKVFLETPVVPTVYGDGFNDDIHAFLETSISANPIFSLDE